METEAPRETFVSRPRPVGLGFKTLVFWEKTGAGEGIRTLDPNLCKVTKRLRRHYSRLSN